MTNVVDLPVITKLPLDPDRVLRAAEGKMDTAVVLGWDKDGEFYFASSDPDGGNIVWLLEMAKRKLYEAAEGV